MIQTKEKIGKLLERFVQGLTTESEEQLLADYFSTAEAIPEEWMVYKELFDSFSTDAYDFSEDEKDAMLARVPRKKAKSVTLWIWAVAACVVAVMVIAIPMMRNSGEMAQKPVAEVRRQVEVKRVVETTPDVSPQKVEPRAKTAPQPAKPAGRAQEKQTEREIAMRAEEILAQGGSMIDIGAFSTRPGAYEVSEEEEGRRLRWALDIVRREVPDAVVSVDTSRPALARRCINDWGADIINDVSEGGITGIVDTPIHEQGDMFKTVGELKVPYILMSVKSNMHDMLKAFAEEVQTLRDYGAKDIILDPGYGFGKTLDENYKILSEAERLLTLELPVLVGVSRKSMIFKLIGGDPTTSLNGTTVLNTISLMKGAAILRVHDVREAWECVKLKPHPRAAQSAASPSPYGGE